MDLSNWDKDEAGRIKAWPLQAFTTVVFDGKAGGVRFEVGVPKQGLASPAIQISMPPDLMRQLAEALLEAADRIDQRGMQPRTPNA